MLYPTTVVVVVVVAINPCMRAGTTRRIYILDMCAADCLSYILPVFFCFVSFSLSVHFLGWKGKLTESSSIRRRRRMSKWAREEEEEREREGGLHLSLLDIVPHSAI